jgi:hypothetical protein
MKSELYIPKIIQDMLQADQIKVKVVPSEGLVQGNLCLVTID